jgi:hypothetical protein
LYSAQIGRGKQRRETEDAARPSRNQRPNEYGETTNSTPQRNEERSAAKPQRKRTREAGGHNMILPDNDFAETGQAK